MRDFTLGLNKSLGLLAAAIGLSTASPASAAYTITFQQVGANVVSTGSGSIDLTGLSFVSSGGTVNAQTNPSFAVAAVGSSTYSYYTGVLGPASFGSGGYTAADAYTGNFVSVNGTAGYTFVPSGYVSGTSLGTSTGTYNNTNFTTLGLTPGTYVYTLGRNATDTITVKIGAAVPEPATWAMMLLGFGAIGFAMRRKARIAALPA